MPKSQEEVIDEFVELWVSNWNTFPKKERERMLRAMLKSVCRALPFEKVQGWYNSLWAKTH